SMAGALESLRRALTHPRLIHWSPDTGQTQIMEELGFLLPKQVILESLPSLPEFLPRASIVKESGGSSVRFIGHFYQEPPRYPRQALKEMAERAIPQWLADTRQPVWNVLAGHVKGMDRDERSRLGLDRDQTY